MRFDNARLPFLDIVRFGAALLVMFGHVRGFYFESIQKLDSPGSLTKAFYLATGAHHEGVVLFFVVSGFLIGGRAWDVIERGDFRLARYFVARFSRIYLVLVPALVLVLFIDTVGSTFLGDTRLFGMRPLEPSGVTSGWTWTQLACHLASLQSLACGTLGVDPPLWSLAFEWQFYFLAPLLIGIAYAPMRLTLRIAAIAMVLLGLASLFPTVNTLLPFLAIWFIGALAARVLARGPLPKAVGLAGLALCIAVVVAARANLLPLSLTDAALATGLALALACPAVIAFGIATRWVARGAGFSYSLYLLHVPVGLLVGASLEKLGYPHALAPPTPLTYFAFATTAVLTLLAAYLFARLTEDKTAAVRRWLAPRPVRAGAIDGETASRAASQV